MARLHPWLLLAVLLGAAADASRAAENDFLDSLSKIVTREARKQLASKKLPFKVGPLAGHIQAVEPERTLAVEVKQFELANDLARTSLNGAGRFQLCGKVNDSVDVIGLFDARVVITAEAQLTKEGSEFYVTPKITEMELGVTILEVLPAELAGSEEFLTSIVAAVCNKNKAAIIDELNKHMRKQRL